jgi:hypothetical protein
MQRLISVHKVPVTGHAFYLAMKMEISPAEKIKLLDFLFDNSEVDINAQIDGSRTFLQFCRKDADLAECFLKRGADPNLGTQREFASGSYWSRDVLFPNSGITLAFAILWGTIEVVELLVQYSAKLEYAGAVHYAVERGEDEMLTRVLELGGNIEKVNSVYINYRRINVTPLYRAVTQGKLNMVEILLQSGASVYGRAGDGKGENGATVLELVRIDGSDEVIRDAVLAAAEPKLGLAISPRLQRRQGHGH